MLQLHAHKKPLESKQAPIELRMESRTHSSRKIENIFIEIFSWMVVLGLIAGVTYGIIFILQNR